MNIKKRGFSLIELIVALAITGIILSAITSMFSYVSKQFSYCLKNNLYKYYANEAIKFIEMQIYSESKNIAVFDDKLILYKNNNKKDIIEAKDDKLIIKYGNIYFMSNDYNIITECIKEFSVHKSNNVVFLKIIMKDGNVKERCFHLKR